MPPYSRSSLHGITSSLLLLVLLQNPTAATAATPPHVPGFERFVRSGEGNAPRSGQLLLGELGCIACHTSSPAENRKQAPVLDEVGRRVRLGHLRRFLTDPQAVKPGTTMPALFVNDPDRPQKVEALVHFLAATGTPRHDRLDLKAIPNGRNLYHQVGCVACHGPRDESGKTLTTSAAVVPLGDLPTKYTVASLMAFLDNPHQSRPSGRMPKILSGKEAKDVACYLLQGIRGDAIAGRGATSYAYYEGEWQTLPDFRKLKPSTTGLGAAFDVGVARREGNYALRFEGVFKVEREGNYRFDLGSDDGSRLEVDGKTVVDNDGLHGTQWKQADVQLTKGIHKVVILFFQAGGGAELEVRVEGPGLPHQELAGLVAPNEAALEKRPAPRKDDSGDDLEIQPALVARGREIFTSVGCADCHSLKAGDRPLTSLRKSPPLRDLKAEGGCLAEAPARGLPVYGLSNGQRSALTAAIKTPPPPPATPTEVIAQTLTTLNCYACHTRDQRGGAEKALETFFTTTQPEMGDEARIPPPLDGVGAKMNPDYLKNLLDKGVHDRPYMKTRMPGFGAANTSHLMTAFAAVDTIATVPPVAFGLQPTQIKSTGRRLVGTESFGCIKCHTFNGERAEGTQGIDMTLLPRRLRRDWFHAYVDDPQRIRPGTRMPSGFDKGKSLLPRVLDGTAHAQIEAMWQYLSDGHAARQPTGMRRQSMPLDPSNGTIIYRNFIEGSGPRAIAVGYPEKIHLAFDANDLRLSLLWQGAFLDAARHWTDRGVGFEGPLGDNLLHLANGPGFAILKKSDEAWPANARAVGQRFLGYRLTADDRPVFLYEVGSVKVEDFPTPLMGKDAALRRTLSLTSTPEPDGLVFRAAVGKKIEDAGQGWFRVDDSWKVKVEGGETTWVRSTGNRAELFVPIRFVNGKARLVQEIVW